MRRFSGFLRKNSGSIARERLKVVLLSDHMNCPPELVDLIKQDMLRVLKKHLDIDTAEVNIQIEISKKTEQGVKNVKTIQIKGL